MWTQRDRIPQVGTSKQDASSWKLPFGPSTSETQGLMAAVLVDEFLDTTFVAIANTRHGGTLLAPGGSKCRILEDLGPKDHLFWSLGTKSWIRSQGHAAASASMIYYSDCGFVRPYRRWA